MSENGESKSLSPTDAEQFERAFSMHISGPVRECECRRVFWDCYNSGYDWAQGEREGLERSQTATAVRHGVECIGLEGRIYCMDCDCWHTRAARITDWMRCHSQQIAEWFRLEKCRREREAAEVPVFEAD